jgi:DnaJ-domain-containing protein 1
MSLEWPTGLGERTPPGERSSTSNFTATLGQTTSQLEDEMDRLDVDRWRGEIANQHSKSNGLPLHNANPDDSGFALRWTKDGTDHAVGCDHYASLRDNVREVYLWMRETRLSGDRPVRTGRSQFASAALPSAEEDAVVAEEPPHEVLEVAPDADPAVIKAAYRQKAKAAHPDRGGDGEQLQRVKRAKERLLEDGGVA